jgi:hypothetical protein
VEALPMVNDHLFPVVLGCLGNENWSKMIYLEMFSHEEQQTIQRQ